MRLTPDAWEQAVAEGGDIATLRDWVAQGHPLIVRRPCLSDDGKAAHLGLALPGKRRMAYRIPLEHVRFVEQPPRWEGDIPGMEGFTLRLFGSHAWQALTGLSYVTEASDVDLVVDIPNREEWERFLTLRVDLPAQPKIDLEVILQGDASFSWREYVGAAEDILIKSNRSVWLERKGRLVDFLR